MNDVVKPTFKKFNSLENSYRENFIHRIREQGYENEQYIVTEKLHGANYSFTVVIENYLPISVIPAKRSGFIAEDENFYNHRPVYEKYVHNIGLLAQSLAVEKNLEMCVVQVFGELYGGSIQGGMAYPLEQDFAGFDITVNGVPINKQSALLKMMENGIPTVPVLGYTDSLSEALEYNESFTTKRLREGFDLNNPQSEAEGVVIEPVEPKFLPSGERVYLKKKTKRFLERGKNKIEKPKVELNGALSNLLQTSLEYINENRFSAVISKEGIVNIKMIGKIAGLMTQDILVDLNKDGIVNNIEDLGESAEIKKFKQTLQGEVTNFIRPLLLKFDT